MNKKQIAQAKARKERKYRHQGAKAHWKGKTSTDFEWRKTDSSNIIVEPTPQIANKKPLLFTQPKVFITETINGVEVIKPYHFKNSEFLNKVMHYSRHILIHHGLLLPKEYVFEIDIRPQISTDVPSALLDVHIKVTSEITHTLHDVLVYLDKDAIMGHGVISIQPKKKLTD